MAKEYEMNDVTGQEGQEFEGRMPRGSTPPTTRGFMNPYSTALRGWALIVFVIIVGLVSAYAFLTPSFPRINKEKWQAVFLQNGQVYFGHIRAINEHYISLRDVFYLQAVQPLQQGATVPPPQFNLVKLGGELHGPEDAMYVPTQAITFWEDMRSDSQVAQAIGSFLVSQNQNK